MVVCCNQNVDKNNCQRSSSRCCVGGGILILHLVVYVHNSSACVKRLGGGDGALSTW